MKKQCFEFNSNWKGHYDSKGVEKDDVKSFYSFVFNQKMKIALSKKIIWL